MKVTTMKVDALEVCTRTRVRQNAPTQNSDVVQEYAEAYRCKLLNEPLDVFREKNTERFIVADGENRLLAAKAAKLEEVPVRLHEGDEIAALDFAISCNQSHGLRRTKADKYHAFKRIMEIEELRKKYPTDRDLAEKIGISIGTVQNYKVDWRNSDEGSKKVKAAKKEAKKSAKQRSPNGRARTEVVAPPKKESAAIVMPNKSKLEPSNGEKRATVKEVSTSDLHELKRSISALAATRVDPAAVAGKIDASNVEKAAQFLWALMEKNS